MRFNTDNFSLLLTQVLILSLLCACSASEPPVEMEFEPIYITYLKKGKTVQFENMDNDQAFRKATGLFQAGEYREARKLFVMVGRNAKAPQARWTGWFNAGICSMSIDDLSMARDNFGLALGEDVEPYERSFARAMLGKCEARLGRWRVALGHFDKVLAAPHVAGEDRADICLWAGRGYLKDKKLHKAETWLDEAERVLLDSVPIRKQQGHANLAQVFFYRGEVHRSFARTIKMRLPQDRMVADLDARRNLFWQAERYYSLGVRIRHPLWSVRCGFALGRMAEEFAGDILAAEVPADMSLDDRELYFKELNPHIYGVLREARGYYRRTVSLAERMSFKNEWVEKARTRVKSVSERLETLKKNTK